MKRKPGQTICSQCNTSYNNAAVPQRCQVCDFTLNGKFVKIEKPLNAKLLTNNLASVRTHPTGANIRTFVDIGDSNKVSDFHLIQVFDHIVL